MHYHLLLYLSALCRGHSKTCKEVAKYFFKGSQSISCGFYLKKYIFFLSAKKKLETLSRAVWCLPNWWKVGTCCAFSVSHLSIAPSLSEEPPVFPDETCGMVPDVYLVRVCHFPLMLILMEGYLLMSRRGCSFPGHASPKPALPVFWGVLVRSKVIP